MFNKQLIKASFSRFADGYDRYAKIQSVSAKMLTDSINKKENFYKILEIGCGTGNYTKLLHKKFPQAIINAIDLSPQMLAVARGKLPNKNISFISGDAEDSKFNEKFNLITSNATFQWFTHLERSLKKYKKYITPQGIINFSLFGPKTYFELAMALRETVNSKLGLSAEDFITKDKLIKIVNKHFSNKAISIKEKVFTRQYKNLWELLKVIKYTGNINNKSSKSLWTREKIAKLEIAYKEKFGKIIATYQIFFCQIINIKR